uniref:Uncharacterized protein n=1 Tax=Setaria digitata TaxID=48799 RepID=A0A915PGV1_9BILA
MRHYLIYYYLLITFYIQQLYSLRCKCNANRGPSPCIGDFCDIHNRDGKRAACGALRRSRQTIFACVLIRQTSNDTYCHVIGSTTACWCRQMDFCNADLEAELFDVDESADDDSKADSDSEESTSTSSSSPPITTSLPPPSSSSPLSSLSSPLLATDQISDNQQQHEFFIDAAIQQVPMNFHTVTTVSPVLSLTIATSTATTVRPADFSVIKQTRKTHINPAIPIDIVEKIKLTPQQRENPPTVVAETISDSYEYELDEK